MVKNKFNLRQKVIIVPKYSNNKYIGYIVGITLYRSYEKAGLTQFGGLKCEGGLLKNYINDCDSVKYKVVYSDKIKYRFDVFNECELHAYNKEMEVEK